LSHIRPSSHLLRAKPVCQRRTDISIFGAAKNVDYRKSGGYLAEKLETNYQCNDSDLQRLMAIIDKLTLTINHKRAEN
jgi:hypothetical protein